MKTLLIFPPAADAAHPPLGIASLAGFLRREGREVELLDLNVRAYQRLLARQSLEDCASAMERRIAALESHPALPAEGLEEYRLLVENVLSAPYLVEEIEGALAALREHATYASRARYGRVSSLVRRAMELVSAAHYPVRWYPRGFSMSWLPTRSGDVLAALGDRRQNLFLPLIEESVSALAVDPPDVVGVSINYYCQVIPGLTVAAAVRRRLPEATVVVGGGLLCFFDGRWDDLAPLAHLVDAWVPYEGEEPLAALLDARERGETLAAVPGVLRFDAGRAVLQPPPAPPDPRELPPPSFDGLPLADYLAPEPVLPILTSRGCYWTRCAFCSHYHLFRRRFRMKTVAGVRAEMDHLAARHGCRTFYLSDEAIPPRTARGLAGVLRREGLGYRWFGESRFERALDAETLGDLAAGGCRMLMFGLESAVPRVLDRMAKGIDPAWAREVLRGCAEAEIRAFVMFFIGFPGETEEEAEETLRFVEDLRGPITHVAFSNFILEHKSPVYREPERYGITEILPYAGEDLKIYSDYRLTEGLSSAEAVSFLERARERPGIRALVDLYLVSRTHLAFLPPMAAEATVEQEAEDGAAAALDLAWQADPDAAGRLIPVRAPGLVPRTLAFNLDEIRQRLSGTAQGEEAPPLAKSPSHYLFEPRREKLFDVGEDGFRLLAPCDGRFTLAEILGVAEEGSRRPVLAFYEQLTRRGALAWEVCP